MFASSRRTEFHALPDDPGDDEGGGRASLLLVLVAAATFVTLTGLSFRQLAEPRSAAKLLEAGVASTVDIDAYLETEITAIEAYLALPGNKVVRLPGFPIDVAVTREEAAGGRSRLRSIVLSRSAAHVYAHGTSSFDATGEQSIDVLSDESLVRLLVDRVNESNYSRARWVALAGATALAASAALFALARRGVEWQRTLGAAVIVGSVPLIGLSGLAYLFAGLYGSDGDPYALEVREVVRSGTWVPLRNGIIVLGAGTALIGSGVILSLANRLIPRTVGRERPGLESNSES